MRGENLMVRGDRVLLVAIFHHLSSRTLRLLLLRDSSHDDVLQREATVLERPREMVGLGKHLVHVASRRDVVSRRGGRLRISVQRSLWLDQPVRRRRDAVFGRGSFPVAVSRPGPGVGDRLPPSFHATLQNGLGPSLEGVRDETDERPHRDADVGEQGRSVRSLPVVRVARVVRVRPANDMVRVHRTGRVDRRVI